MAQYHHLQPLDRKYISDWHNTGLSFSEIARRLSRATSTISREVARNSNGNGVYRPKPANTRALERRSHSRLKITGLVAEIVIQGLEQDLSPDQIVMAYPKLPVCTQSIYNHVWRDYQQRGDLWRRLRYCGKGKHLRLYSNGPGKARTTRNRESSIDNRPDSVHNRVHYGHWEMDLIEGQGRQRPVLVIIERKTRFLLAGFLKAKWSCEVARVAKRLLAGFKIHSITCDNGPEFMDTELIESTLNTKLYYAHPYKSWQKGGVENVNKLLRQYLPKGFSFMPYSNSLPSISCKKINNRPRRILNSKSPQSLLKHLKLGT